MKKLIVVLLFLVNTIAALSQEEYYERLPINGGVSTLGISPSEEIWIATLAGNIYYTKQIGGLWKLGPFGTYDMLSQSYGETFERINFFSEDTMMISGFIQEDGKQDFVYWSGDHGKSWQKVIFGESSWMDAGFINNKGNAWLSGSSQLIYYTADYGRTWTSFDKVDETGNLRFASIHFGDNGKTGLFGSFWNVLYRTNDNCQTWEKLPTPLDQKKYKTQSKYERPEFMKVRIFGNYYIVNQEGRVYYSRSDSISWTGLPRIADFEVSDQGKIYTINKDRTVELLDEALSCTWRSKDTLDAIPRAIAVRNGKLFALTYGKIYKICPTDFVVSQLLTDEIPISEPWITVNFNGNKYGFERKDILRFDNARNLWQRFMTIAFPISNATLFDGTLIVMDNTLNRHYCVDEEKKTVEEFTLPGKLFDVASNKITGFHFENGSQGCFHHNNARRSYKLKGNIFKLQRSSPYLSGMPNKIEAGVINDLLELIDSSRFLKVKAADLNISKSDIEAFKTFIDKEAKRIKENGIDRFDQSLYSFRGDYINFDTYKDIADSLYSLPEASIDDAFWQAYGNWSTTIDWRRIIFVFSDGRKLVVENSDDKPNYLYTPWVVDYEGLKFRINSIRFGQVIDELTNGKFFMDTAREKRYAIFNIADFLYKGRLNSQE